MAALFILRGAALSAFGIFCSVVAPSPVFLGGGIALMSAGIAFFGIAVYACRTLYSRDRERYGTIVSILKDNISSIISEAANITEVRYED